MKKLTTGRSPNMDVPMQGLPARNPIMLARADTISYDYDYYGSTLALDWAETELRVLGSMAAGETSFNRLRELVKNAGTSLSQMKREGAMLVVDSIRQDDGKFSDDLKVSLEPLRRDLSTPVSAWYMRESILRNKPPYDHLAYPTTLQPYNKWDNTLTQDGYCSKLPLTEYKRQA